MATIKESVEALEAAKVILGIVKKVLADGKVNVGDIGVLFELVSALGVLNAGIQGVALIPGELKELDAAESQELINKALEIVALFKA